MGGDPDAALPVAKEQHVVTADRDAARADLRPRTGRTDRLDERTGIAAGGHLDPLTVAHQVSVEPALSLADQERADEHRCREKQDHTQHHPRLP